jgi:hypothetical protein
MNASERRALMILADCSTGATGPALQSRGVSEATLTALVSRGLVVSHLRTFANPPGLRVMHYWSRPGTTQ